MSCGKPHETPCTEVLDRVYSYLDGELGPSGKAEIRQHLDECGPCLREYGLEVAVKRLVHVIPLDLVREPPPDAPYDLITCRNVVIRPSASTPASVTPALP